jgi:hypothetical protein
MPRKQRFKPSRKPKPVDSTSNPNQNTAQDASPPAAVMAPDPSSTPNDVSGET